MACHLLFRPTAEWMMDEPKFSLGDLEEEEVEEEVDWAMLA